VASLVGGFPVTDSVLAPLGSGTGMPAMVPAGMRAVTVDVSESSGVAGLLTPGCRVDVIATLRDGDQAVARTIVENVKVQFVQRGRSSSSSGRTTIAGSPDGGPVKTVTLLVTPKQAAQIELANSSGKPRLVLRGSADGSNDGNASASQNELLGKPDVAPAPPPAPAPVTDAFSEQPEPKKTGRPVQIIKGGNETIINFDDETGNKEAGSGGGSGAAPAAGKGSKSAGEEQRTVSGAEPGKASRTDAGRGNLR
jgi:pilus assembly protein CpaB